MKLLTLFLLFCGAVAQDLVAETLDQSNLTEVVERLTLETRSGSTYMFHSNPLSWDAAQKQCQTDGGYLAVISSRTEEDQVKGLTLGTASWIGLYNVLGTNSWFWVDNESLRHTNWCSGQPETPAEYQGCGLINFSNFKCWNDQSCSQALPFVCEIKN